MAKQQKQMVYFNAVRQIETITIKYNDKLDGDFVDDVCTYIKEVSKKMPRVDLKNPREVYTVTVFVYPSVKMFNQIFNGVIEKRYYQRRRSLQDLYVVRDEGGNIHIASPRGRGTEQAEAFKRILVMNVLGEYMNEQDKQTADRMLRASMVKKKEEQEIEEVEEPIEEEEIEPEVVEEEEVSEEEMDELIMLEDEIADIDAEEGTLDADVEDEEVHEVSEDDMVPGSVVQARQWLSLGWMGYLSGRLNGEKEVRYFAEHISANGVKKLGKLKDTGWYERYNYSQEYSIAIVEYIVSTYGVRTFKKFYEDPTDYEHTLGISKRAFEARVKAYIYGKYGPNRMKEEVEEKADEDLSVTEVRIDRNGGATITELQIEQEPPVLEIV
ncbi:MAG: hypothetical protein IKK84_05185 [Clostridia bacterium]|nr:hypothetical protein [Clostridia bacterium]